MTALLIEDDPNKALKIQDYLLANFPQILLLSVFSYQGAMKEIFSQQFDFIILDMSIPTYDHIQGSFSGKPRNFGGRDILKEMKRYRKKSAVIVITQYNEFDGGSISMTELDCQLKLSYHSLYKGYILFDSKQSKWELELKKFIEGL